MTDDKVLEFHKLEPTAFTWTFNNEEICRLNADGTFEHGPAWKGMDDAAKKMFEHMSQYAGTKFKSQKDEIALLREAVFHVLDLYDAESWPIENDLDMDLLRKAVGTEKQYEH